MHSLRRHRRSLAWLPFIALLALVIVPTLARALGGGGWAEVCTPQGVRVVALNGGEPAAPVAASPDHCALCSVHADPPLPPAAPRALPLLPTPAAEPPLFLHAPRVPFAWAAAQPRGPPATA